MSELFITAMREHYRFETVKGDMTTEQLWDLELTSERTGIVTLDDVAMRVNANLQDSKQVSFVTDKSPKATLLEGKLEVVKFIIAVKKKEQEEKEARLAEAELREEALNVLAARKVSKLKKMSDEDLRKLASGK